jgi:nucleoside-diphosphate-sugar epimerase
MKTILITGSAGFIGTHLSDHYLKLGYKVVGLDNYLTGSAENTSYLLSAHPQNFSFIKHDVTMEWPHLNLKNLKYIFHLASPASVKSYQKFPIETLQVNSIGLQKALAYADQKKARLIFTSTSEIYGSPLQNPQKEGHWGQVNSFGERSCYDEAKRFGEALIYTHNRVNSTQHGLVRIFNTYGSRMHPADDRVINSFILQAKNNKNITVAGNGKQTRSFCYISDLIEGLTAYADSSINFPINLGNSREISVLELAYLILKLTASSSVIEFKELPSDDPPQRSPDLTLAKKHLNYAPKISLEEGLKKLIDTQ